MYRMATGWLSFINSEKNKKKQTNKQNIQERFTQRSGDGADHHSRVSLLGLDSRVRRSCSHCSEWFSSFLRHSVSVPPLLSACCRCSRCMCLLSNTKPRMHGKKEMVRKPSVRPRYTILMGPKIN